MKTLCDQVNEAIEIYKAEFRKAPQVVVISERYREELKLELVNDMGGNMQTVEDVLKSGHFGLYGIYCIFSPRQDISMEVF